MLRVARTEDSFAIAAIYRHYVNTTATALEDVDPSTPVMRYKIAKVGAVLPFLVWEEGGEALGYACAMRHSKKAALRWSLQDMVYLRKDAQGRGLGRRLLTALLELLWELGYIKVYAVITRPNPACEAIHKKLGFTSLCLFSDTAYKLGAWQSVEWMELTLRAPSDYPPGMPPLEPLAFSDFVRANPSLLASILKSGERTWSPSLSSSPF